MLLLTIKYINNRMKGIMCSVDDNVTITSERSTEEKAYDL